MGGWKLDGFHNYNMKHNNYSFMDAVFVGN